jgi:hypothetical protein
MEKTRVPYGERYWYLVFFGGEVLIYSNTERNFTDDNQHFAMGNYFYTKEEAESMARKLRAVLNGAEVIEMPSEEECTNAADEHIELCSEECFPYQNEDEARAAFCNGIDWLKSKIVK